MKNQNPNLKEEGSRKNRFKKKPKISIAKKIFHEDNPITLETTHSVPISLLFVGIVCLISLGLISLRNNFSKFFANYIIVPMKFIIMYNL